MRKQLILKWIRNWAHAIIRSEADFITSQGKAEAAAQAHVYATIFQDLAEISGMDYKTMLYLPMMRTVDNNRANYEARLKAEFDDARRALEELANGSAI